MLKLNTKSLLLLVAGLVTGATSSINLSASDELVDSWKAWIPGLLNHNFRQLRFGQPPCEANTSALRSTRTPSIALLTPADRPVGEMGSIYTYLENPNVNPRHWANILKPETQAFIRALIQFVIFHRLLDYDSSTNYQEGYPAEAYPLDSALNYSFIRYIANQPGATPEVRIWNAENILAREFQSISQFTLEELIQNAHAAYEQEYRQITGQNLVKERVNDENSINEYYDYLVLLVYMLSNLPKLTQALLEQHARQYAHLSVAELARSLPTSGILEALIQRALVDFTKPITREQAERDFQALLKKPENQLESQTSNSDNPENDQA